jgi:hypothetical protein
MQYVIEYYIYIMIIEIRIVKEGQFLKLHAIYLPLLDLYDMMV